MFSFEDENAEAKSKDVAAVPMRSWHHTAQLGSRDI
jgi:hypothetical protein